MTPDTLKTLRERAASIQDGSQFHPMNEREQDELTLTQALIVAHETLDEITWENKTEGPSNALWHRQNLASRALATIAEKIKELSK